MKPGALRKAFNRYRFWLMLALLFASQVTIVGIFFLALRLDLDQTQRTLLDLLLTQRVAPMLLLAMLLLTAQGIALKALISNYLAPMARLAEEVVLLTSHHGHRIVPQGAREVRDLAGKLNALAATHRQLHEDVQATVDSANRALAEQKDRLAALMAELELSVLVCNLEGRILLYNARARQLFGAGQGGAARAAAIGLGRSLFGVLERGLIVHALEQIQYQLQHPGEGAARPVSGFVTSLGPGRMVRAHMAPVLDGGGALNGFVLTLEDITRNVEADNRRDALQQLLTQDARATLANIRAAVETMQSFPDMSETKRGQFTAIIDDESQRLASQIERAEQQHAGDPGSQWQLEEMRGSDLLGLLRRRIDTAALHTDDDHADHGALWLKIDSYTLTQALAHLAQHLFRDQGVSHLRLGLTQVGRLAHLELRWGGALPAGTLRLWESEPLQLGARQGALTLASVVAGQGGAAVYRFDPFERVSCYRVLLPLAPPRAPLETAAAHPGRPEFYDFDLFHQSGQTSALDERLLSQLSYTVFDTETTGLQPAGGDEIISIGALRVVNGRLLEQESFDQLVQPNMFLSAASSAIHGITDAMLKGRPEIDAVLPQFHRFAEDTVLVAHNAAFDMKFLQMKEARTGIVFSQPVLDTLLLSQVIHPHQEQHSLEAIAQRFGVNIVGRHTALGDALVTGEVFLKMLPLLAEKGIFTLKQAREAEQETAYARIRY